MVKNFKDLEFWKTSFKTAVLTINLLRKFPKDTISYIIERQIVRSSVSIGANIAEGFGRYKGKEYERFLQIALGSANETEYWLLILRETYSNFVKEIDTILAINNQTIRMLASSLKSLRRKKAN